MITVIVNNFTCIERNNKRKRQKKINSHNLESRKRI